jgi:hypothetical protein
MSERVPVSFYRNDIVTLFYEGQKIEDSPERVFACYSACRNIPTEQLVIDHVEWLTIKARNAEVVPELVAMVEKLQLALAVFMVGSEPPTDYIKGKCLDVYQEALALLDKVKT